ncbi:MAG: dNTP triphosphohydrolase [Vampirovibrionales bacterium]|nr:dNTP triphosphohydrolase [Vampirovibrionales bacterium]
MSVQQASVCIRANTETRELTELSPLAAKSVQSKGRAKPEQPCPVRTEFQRDRDRILHSKAFRRLKHKTQVFIAPSGDHYRTRLTHSLEVSQIARTMARALRLNEDLTEAIALGHDVGHPPFGHAGEAELNQLLARYYEPARSSQKISADTSQAALHAGRGFSHTAHTLRIYTQLEPKNLTHETLNGLSAQGHTEEGAPVHETLEGQLVELADRVAYLHHDVEDATRAGLMNDTDLPEPILETLGQTRSHRLETMIIDIINTSQQCFDAQTPRIAMSPGVYESTMQLRAWMHRNVYQSTPKLAQDTRVSQVMGGLFRYFVAHPERMPEASRAIYLAQATPLPLQVADYIAGMTDRFAIGFYIDQLLPQSR